MLTISMQQAKQLYERRKISGAMLVDKVKLLLSVRFDAVLAFNSPLLRTSSFIWHPPAPTSKQKVNFTFDLVTYFLFLVRGLASYQDAGKCQDGGSAVWRPPGCQIRWLSGGWRRYVGRKKCVKMKTVAFEWNNSIQKHIAAWFWLKSCCHICVMWHFITI